MQTENLLFSLFFGFLEHYWYALAFLLLVGLFFFMRFQRKRSFIPFFSEEIEPQLDEVPFQKVSDPTLTDLEAYRIVQSYREKIWWNASFKTDYSPGTVGELSQTLIHDIAKVYYPADDQPELKVSMTDLLNLNRRISDRLLLAMDRFPLSSLKHLEIVDILRYKTYFDIVSEHRMVKFLKDHAYLWDSVKKLWAAYNLLNPAYWTRRAIYTAGQEGGIRYLLTLMMTVIGEEAILLYSRRDLKKPETHTEKSKVRAMINTFIEQKDVNGARLEEVLLTILDNGKLDNQLKIELIRSLLAKEMIPVDSVGLPFEKRGVKETLARLFEHLTTLGHQNNQKKLLPLLTGGEEPLALRFWKKVSRTKNREEA
ncbi:MAG: hypothetical protein HY731_03290 [Candidatus Tectomicrobia bacterium]|nr:hypothetical protein [Candidatus Tectomicrobia bacterium]